jgi:hypothetical protein
MTTPVQPENTLQNTLGSKTWVSANREKLRKLLPETWTHPANFNVVGFSFQLKLLGVDWRSEEELATVFAFLERTKILLRDGILIRRST